MRPVHYLLLVQSKAPIVEAQAQAVEAQAQTAPPPGLLARLRAIFTGWRLFDREGNYDTERTKTYDR